MANLAGIIIMDFSQYLTLGICIYYTIYQFFRPNWTIYRFRWFYISSFLFLGYACKWNCNTYFNNVVYGYRFYGELDYTSLQELGNLLTDHGWTYLTALNLMLFSLLHWPCTTTLLTIKKETKSIKWTALDF